MKKSNSGYFSLSCFKNIIAFQYVLVMVLMVSCTSALYMPTASQQTESASLSQLLEGRKLYVQKCGSCHTLVLPDKHTKHEWQHFLDEMQQKAAIDNSEKEQILRYLSKGN